MNTIFALATAHGKAGVAIIRISGASAFSGVSKLVGYLKHEKSMALRAVRSPEGDLLDQALVLTFVAGASFTGEDVVELQLHGSPAITQAVLRQLSLLEGFVAAEAGEFTRRALENGCLDLTQVEGLADLIEAETEAQRVQAIRVFDGALGAKVDVWRQRLIRAVSLVEATIDFADEDVPTDVMPEVRELLEAVLNELSLEAAGVEIAERVRDGFEVAIVGAPNVGKSTLLNAIAGRDAAITSEYAGTTRDVIEVKIDLGGLPVTFLDTAGLRDADNAVEQIGIRRALDRGAQADLRVVLLMDDKLPEIDLLEGDEVLVAHSDQGLDPNKEISGLSGFGVSELLARVANKLGHRASGAGLAIKERHLVALTDGLNSLTAVTDMIEVGDYLEEILSENIRDAIKSLDALVGRMDVEDVLDEIFLSFCIGK